MFRDWIPAKAWPITDKIAASTHRSRFEPAASWPAAAAATSGYEAVTATLAPISGAAWNTGFPAVDSRDLQVLSGFGIALQDNLENQPVRVLDLGGWTGIYSVPVVLSYPRLAFDWTVLETPRSLLAVAGSGRPNHLRWVGDPQDVVGTFRVALASAALHYFPDPIERLTWLCARSEFVIINRNPLWPIAEHRVACQWTDRKAGSGYPTWFFSDARFREAVGALGKIRLEWEVPEDSAYFAGVRRNYQGMLVESAVFNGV